MADAGVAVKTARGCRGSPGRRFRPTAARNAARSRSAAGLISARRQCDGVPEMCVTPCRASRARKSRDRLSARSRARARRRQHRAEEDLQAAVAADVVERAPDGAPSAGLGAHGRSETGEVVHDHLRHAGRAGSHEHPLGARAWCGSSDRFDRQRTDDANGKVKCRVRRGCRIDDDGIDTGHRYDRRQDGQPRHRAAGSRGGARSRRVRSTPLPPSVDFRSRQEPIAPPARESAPKTCAALKTRTLIKIGKANGFGAIPKKSRR